MLAVAGAGPGPPFIYYVLVLMAPTDTLRIAQMASVFSSIDVILALRGRCATEVVVDLTHGHTTSSSEPGG